MAEPPAQSYARHVHRPALSTWASLFATIALALFINEVAQRPSLLSVALLCVGVAVILLVAISRVYIVRLQNRIIRLEMRVRLARLGLEHHYDRLATGQLVALRFASDAELPALLERALAEHLTNRQIKEAVRDWQPDYHRT
jgi:Family of unknown function (DUF6526)